MTPLTDDEAPDDIGFWIFDEALVALETPTAIIAVDRPSEVSLYLRMFEALKGPARTGAAARELILQVMRELSPD